MEKVESMRTSDLYRMRAERIAANLERLMREEGFCRKSLAHKSGVSLNAIGMVLRADGMRNLTTYWKLADALGADITEVIA